ncbi:MAG: hypothetical protein M1820_004460 [Bogoriella megaspora]|nr:MAG: hypothetical protein M1820_004460 [Bogoriella megaspora]
MIDPLSATSLAGTIITFLEVCEKLGSVTHEIYRSAEGTTKDLERRKAFATTLAELSNKLRNGIDPQATLEGSEKDLDKLAKDCEAEANELWKLLTIYGNASMQKDLLELSERSRKMEMNQNCKAGPDTTNCIFHKNRLYLTAKRSLRTSSKTGPAPWRWNFPDYYTNTAST